MKNKNVIQQQVYCMPPAAKDIHPSPNTKQWDIHLKYHVLNDRGYIQFFSVFLEKSLKTICKHLQVFNFFHQRFCIWF